MIRGAKVGDRVVQLRPVRLHGTVIRVRRFGTRGDHVLIDVMRDGRGLREGLYPAELVREVVERADDRV